VSAPGWVSARVRSARGQRLIVTHRADEPCWLDIAATFWDGRLEGLERVRSSAGAVVTRGRVGGNVSYFFKRFRVRGVRDALKRLLRGSRALRAHAGGDLAVACGFHAPRVVCRIETSCCGLPGESALVTAAVEGAFDLRQWLSRADLGVCGDRDAKRRLVRDFAAEVGRWHALGLYHGDMRLGNVFCRRDRDGFAFVWLDNERNRRFAALRWRHRIQNLVQVNCDSDGVTLCDRMRFFRAYLERTPLDFAARRRAMREVLERTRARWRVWGHL